MIHNVGFSLINWLGCDAVIPKATTNSDPQPMLRLPMDRKVQNVSYFKNSEIGGPRMRISAVAALSTSAVAACAPRPWWPVHLGRGGLLHLGHDGLCSRLYFLAMMASASLAILNR